MLTEWYEMTKSDMKYLIAGIPIGPIIIASLFSIMLFIDDTKYLFLTYAVIICTIDLAMFGGRAIGGPKLAPSISPQKTVSGLCVGVVSSMIIVQTLTFLPNYDFPYHGLCLSCWCFKHCCTS
ncbi:MAG UNVERIFIED_CONTAM: phosphatidate cytidylyltransferase [Rickettsiaceae bacterium]|jgi:phosphatidate cytidylyltransferase